MKIHIIKALKQEELMQAKKVKRDLSTKDLDNNVTAPTPIYINESPSPENKRIFYQSRVIKKEKQIKYLWVKNGKMKMRKDYHAKDIKRCSLKNTQYLDIITLNSTKMEDNLTFEFKTLRVKNTWEIGKLESRATGLSLIHTNIRSISKNLNELLALLASLKVSFDIIVLSETWHIDDHKNFDINDYVTYYNQGNINQNDGTIAFVKNSLHHECDII